MNLNLPKESSDFGVLSGTVQVKEDIFGDLDFALEASRCSVGLKECEKYGNLNSKGLCKKLKEKNAIYSPFIRSFQPNFECPIKAGNYTMPETTIDLRFAKIFPVDGFVFISTWKWVALDRKAKLKRTVMCYYLEVQIMIVNKKV